MDSGTARWTLGELADLLGGELVGDPDFPIARPMPSHSDDPAGITFAENDDYLAEAIHSGVGAVLIPLDCLNFPKPAIRVKSPRAAFGQILAMAHRQLGLDEGTHPSAVLHRTSWIDPSSSIGAHVVVGKNTRIGARCKVHPGCYLGEDCVIGDGVILYPNVVLVQDIHVGEGTIIHSGAVLGADGFGLVWDGAQRVKVPQVGGVRVGKFCEIGAGTCIDRATCGETILEDGVKIDNLVQIGHNCQIGEHSVIAGQSSLAGSVTIGKRLTSGGQIGIKDHLKIGDDVFLGGRTGVMQNIETPGQYFGMPAVPARESLRQMAAVGQLPELIKRVKRLEAELASLKENKE